MKNIYQVHPYIRQITNLDLDIYLKIPDGSESNMINNIRLLELFGFDKLNENLISVPDGKFDNRLGINFEFRTSEIIFPVIQPFGNNIPSLLNGYKYQAIYDTLKTYLSLPGNSFIIKGKYKPILEFASWRLSTAKGQEYIQIDKFLEQNPFIEHDKSLIEGIKLELIKAYDTSVFEKQIRGLIKNKKEVIDSELKDENKEQQSKKQDFDKLLELIATYVSSISRFKKSFAKSL